MYIHTSYYNMFMCKYFSILNLYSIPCSECLEELGVLVQNNGMIVCGPTPQKTLPLVAAQISDRDNAVRSAALNTMVVVYSHVGEGVFKFTSQVSAAPARGGVNSSVHACMGQ